METEKERVLDDLLGFLEKNWVDGDKEDEEKAYQTFSEEDEIEQEDPYE